MFKAPFDTTALLGRAAALLTDRIVLMTNGPGARIAEIVVNTMPGNERHRNDLHRHPQPRRGESLEGVRPADLPLLRACPSLRHDLEGTDPRRIRRRRHGRHRLRTPPI